MEHLVQELAWARMSEEATKFRAAELGGRALRYAPAPVAPASPRRGIFRRQTSAPMPFMERSR